MAAVLGQECHREAASERVSGSSARERTIGVSGTFNAMEAAGLGAGSAPDRIARASEGCFTRLNAIRFAWGGGEVREAV